MKNIVNGSLFSVALLGMLVGCTNSTTSELDVAKEKTTKFAQDLLAGKETSASMFIKDASYDASATPILVDSKGNIAEGGMLKYFDEDNHSVKFVATDENELTISIDINDDGFFSDDEIYIAIDPEGEGAPIDIYIDYVPIEDWLSQHNDTDSTDVYIVLPGQFISPLSGNEITTEMVQVDVEATKRQILEFVTENNLVRNESINEAIESGMDSKFHINLTKAKIESLLEKYDDYEIWIELLDSVTIIE